MNRALEPLVIVAIILGPMVLASLYVAANLKRRRERPETTEVTAGRAPETPFVVIATVALVIALVAAIAVALTIVARQLG